MSHAEEPSQQNGAARRWGLMLGPVVFFGILLFADLTPGEPAVTRMAAVASLMAIWWITEAIPLAATSLLPLVLYPLLGIMTGRETAPIYVNHVIFLFIGGFTIALAMERWGLHKRIALWIVRAIGGGPSRLVLSFLLASAFLSMWISNTATAIMMLAIGLAIIRQLEESLGTEPVARWSVALLLSIAYGASIGGMATLVGTPPNLSLVRIYEIVYPTAEPIGFGQWMLLGLPLSLCMLAIVWLLLTQVFFRAPAGLELSQGTIRQNYARLGPIKFAEGAVLTVFVLTAALWVFRKDLALGVGTVPGWSRLLPYPEMMDDGTVAILMALSLFLIPSRAGQAYGNGAILDQQVFRKLPWSIVLLFGGGFALAQGFQVAGLSGYVGSQFAGLEGTPPVLQIAGVCVVLTFMTELTSNTATTELMLPILASVADTLRVHPLSLMIPAALAASCAFMMPVATPPNAIVFGSGRVKIGEMAAVGLAINLIGVVLITAVFLALGSAVFGLD